MEIRSTAWLPDGLRRVMLLTVLFLASAAAPPERHTAPDRVVRVGVYQNEPKVFMDNSGHAAGIFIDLLAAIAAREGWTPQYVPCRWSECLANLEQGRIDLMVDVAYSRERDSIYDFNEIPVLESWSQLYSGPKAEVDSLHDLDGKRIAVLGGSIQMTYFRQMTRGFGFDVTIVPTGSLAEAFDLARSGTVDAAVANHFFGDHFFQQYGLTKTPIVFNVAELHFAVARGRNADLLDAIDRHMDTWRRESNSAYYRTLGYWMERAPEGYVPRHVAWVLGITLGMLALASAVILLLRARVKARTRHLAVANAELRQAESAARESEALLKAVQRLSKIGGWEWDVARQRMTWTEEAYRIHGLPQGSDTSVSPDDVARGLACYDPADRVVLEDAFRRCVERGEPYDMELALTNAEGERLWVHATAEPIRDASGAVAKVLGNLLDLTDRKEAEQARQDLEEQLRQSQKMEAIGRLAGGIAHDFNNLLTVILNYTEIAIQGIEDNRRPDEELRAVHTAAESAETLVRQLLAFSRKQVLDVQPINLNDIAAEIEKMMGRILGEDIDMQQRLAPDLGLTLADRGQLSQVLMNLVLNARDAMPNGGRLTIETANAELDESFVARHIELSPGPYVVLSVTDSGCGMDGKTRERIFEPFFTTKAPGMGTGLGLSTVYGIVKQSGGDISVYSEPGRGATFKVYLPRASSPATSRAAAAEPSPRPVTAETILVVEDEDAVRDLATRVLTDEGYSVISASGGEEAMEICATHAGAIHLVLTDVVMPKMSGKLLAERLEKERPETRVLYMSGYDDDAIVRHGTLDAGLRFISKPFTSAELKEKVRESLDSSEDQM